MIYVLLPHGDLGWDDLRVFTSFPAVERLVTPFNYVIAFEGTDELEAVWLYQLEKGRLRRFPISPSP
jgi:hypothetical protein